LSQVFVSKVGRKGAIYLPRRVLKLLNVGEGDKVLIRFEGDRLVMEFLSDPLTLALKVKKWAKTTVREFEKESEEEQDDLYSG